MGSSTAQINARVDVALKAAGDAALARAGLTPTRAIRSLWQRLADLGDQAEEVRELVSGPRSEPASTDRAERERRIALAREGSQIVARSLASRGVAAPEQLEELPYEELRERALLERLEERGLDR